jgi:hypothetical protein
MGMQRIAVVGSGGAGKSTSARQLLNRALTRSGEMSSDMRLSTLTISLAVALALTSCESTVETASKQEASSSSMSSSATTTSTVTTSAHGDPDAPCSPGGSSPARFNPAAGTYAVYLTAVDPGRRMLSFDVIQFLVGEEAATAYHRDVPDDPDGPPNDYYIVNENGQVRESAISTDARVRLVRLREDSDADLDPATFEELPAYLENSPRPEGATALSANPYWLTVKDNVVVDLCEQYVP